MKHLLFIAFCLIAHQLSATHLLGGYISYRSLQNQKYEITVHLLMDPNSEIRGGTGVIDFGDGLIKLGGFSNVEKQNAGNVSILTFTATHTYSAFGSYTVSYTEPNYNPSINNIEESGSIPLFISARIENDPAIGSNTSPVLALFNGQNGISGIKQRINSAAFDNEDDSLTYTLIAPNKSEDQQLQAYTFPNDAAYYNNYQSGNENNDGVPTYTISPVTGEIFWDAPEMLGEYALAYRISEWRKISGNWFNIGGTDVILIDRIVDSEPVLSITGPEPQCYDNTSQVDVQFNLKGRGGEEAAVKVFSDLDGALINEIPVSMSEVLNFELEETLLLNFKLPSDIVIKPFKPYHLIIRIDAPSENLTFSWAFAIGCDELSENIPPEPIDKETDCEAFTIYPNPAFGETINICIPVKNDEIKHLRIVDMEGKLVYSDDVISSRSEVDIGGLHPGIYLLQVDQFTRMFMIRN